MNATNLACASSDAAKRWDGTDWSRCEREVRRLRARIVKAVQEAFCAPIRYCPWKFGMHHGQTPPGPDLAEPCRVDSTARRPRRAGRARRSAQTLRCRESPRGLRRMAAKRHAPQLRFLPSRAVPRRRARLAGNGQQRADGVCPLSRAGKAQGCGELLESPPGARGKCRIPRGMTRPCFPCVSRRVCVP